MAVYRMMRESFATDQGYLPGLAWVYDGRQIYLTALPTYEPERADLQAQIDHALANGFHSDEVWTHWAQQGGQHQLSMRSAPEPLIAPSLKAAIDAALASLQTAR
jgi:hypothetical protein